MYIAVDSADTAIIDWFRWHFKELKMGLIAAITGSYYYRFGVGKSYLSLRIGELLDPTFSIDKVVFEPKDFEKAISLVEEIGKPSQVITLDEAGILANAKRWYSMINRSISAAMMTFRALRGLCLVVTPALRFVDSDIRIAVSHQFVCNKVVETDHVVKVYANFYKLTWSEIQEKFYHIIPTLYSRKDKHLIKVRKFEVSLPQTSELVQQYEEKVTKYKMAVRHAVGKIEDG